MSRTTTAVGGRRIELSNLKKTLFPEDGIVKAELIEYYLKIAPTILRHIKGRPLSFIRYPDGITGETFFQKNRPDWTPKWIQHKALGNDSKIDYILPTEEACLVWLANLACIEIHQMHCRSPYFEQPDYIVFDLDPPEGLAFGKVIEIAFNLKEHLEMYGYQTFVKTSGGKGLHIFVPLVRKGGFDEVFSAASEIAKTFIETHPEDTTLHIKKEARKNKVLVDIYRNRPTQTIVSPYSVRGQVAAPVSMPLRWEQLLSMGSPTEFTLRSAFEYLLQEGDSWESMGAYATSLHTDRKRNIIGAQGADDSLKDYGRKRQFSKTPEPAPSIALGDGSSFVVHRHHASRLHYDLRLEKDGVLQSWAVPRGLPPRLGTKRLAVAVENHPLSYLRFEGDIPKGQYGAGSMWIFALGKYEITKEKKDSFYFRLQSPELTAEYRLIHTKDKDWLLERVDPLQTDWLQDPIEPMLAGSASEPPDSSDFLYEVKWDGIRAMISVEDGTLRIRSRNQRDITGFFPELCIPDRAFRASCGLFDAELVCLDPDGRPLFDQVMKRIRQASETAIIRASQRFPAICYLFDCLYLDGRPLLAYPLRRRREWLSDSLRSVPEYRISETVDDGRGLFEAASRMGLEGIMAKHRDSPYLPGKRSTQWIKIKARGTTDCIVLGYTRGKGNRSNTFGALHLGAYRGGRLVYQGKVGTGFDDTLLESISRELGQLQAGTRPIPDKLPDDAETVWLRPELVCEVQFAASRMGAALREPVFVRLRPDRHPEDCQVDNT